MVATAEIRRIALALPEAYEDVHRLAPAFRVNRRIFGMLRDDHLVIKLDREHQLNMIEGHAGVVAPGVHYSHHGWTIVWFEKVEVALMDTLLRLAWAHVAPKRLVRDANG